MRTLRQQLNIEFFGLGEKVDFCGTWQPSVRYADILLIVCVLQKEMMIPVFCSAYILTAAASS